MLTLEREISCRARLKPFDQLEAKIGGWNFVGCDPASVLGERGAELGELSLDPRADLLA